MSLMRQPASSSLSATRNLCWRTVGLGFVLLLTLASLDGADAPVPLAPPATTTKNASPEPDLHTFTDTQGRTLKAQVLSLLGTTVRLKRDDGNTFEAPLATLSKADQTYIVETVLKQYAAHGDVIFKFSAQSQTTATASAKIAGGTQLNWRESYKVTLKNQTMLALTDLRVRVIVFKVLLLPDAPRAGESSILLFGQTHNLDQAPVGTDTTFLTDPLDMQQLLANAGGYFPAAPSAHAETDKLLALWVRVYDSNNYVVQEWCSEPTLTKQQRWDDAWTMATGQANRATPARTTRGLRNGALNPSNLNSSSGGQRGS